MFSFLPAPVIGLCTSLLLAISTVFWSFVLYFFAIFTLIPLPRVRGFFIRIIHTLPVLWTDCNAFIYKLFLPTRFTVKGLEGLKENDWYILVANHQSWLDILVLFKVFNRKIPTLKFFMKRELLWQLPVASQACWLMGFPFMKRYSKEFLKKHPELKGKDIESTKQSCAKFKTMPSAILNFIEGGRFTLSKHQRQGSPYRFLLKPKAGGVAFALTVLSDTVHCILDVTVVYPDGNTFLDFLCGKVKNIIVDVEAIPVTAELSGDYENDRESRTYFQQWLNQRWQKKDEKIDHILMKVGSKKSDAVYEK
jgi:1-acyl-sn-glycerol-3-phosphate acyltransferase